MNGLHWAAARALVLERMGVAKPGVERVSLLEASGRTLAEPVVADRDTPPADRSIRDGYAVRAADLPGELRVVGEVRAGEPALARVQAGQAVEIMTGAALPAGADAVVMVEHTTRDGDRVCTDRAGAVGQFVNRRGAECRQGDRLLGAGQVLDFAALALCAMVGQEPVAVYRRPRVAILSTGDEVVEVGTQPEPHQVRNSNAVSLAAQVSKAGGEPWILPVAPDRYEETRRLIELGRQADLLLLSGGVSAGKYDLVETVLADLGAEFLFTRVLIQPGQPLVFGRLGEGFFFGLPGNPASTMVTFHLFARAAVQRLAGVETPELGMVEARLTEAFRHKTGLTRFLPARLSPDGPCLTPLRWQGSSDVAAMARANALMVVDDDREEWGAGEAIRTLPL